MTGKYVYNVYILSLSRLNLTFGTVQDVVSVGLVGTTQRADGRYDQGRYIHRHRLIVDGLVGLYWPPVHDARDTVPPGTGHQDRVVPAAQPLILARAVFAIALHRCRQIIVFGVEGIFGPVVVHHHYVSADHRHSVKTKNTGYSR